MQRLGRLAAALAFMMPACAEMTPCRAQTSASPSSTTPPKQKEQLTKETATAPGQPSQVARSTSRVPPPRPWRAAMAPRAASPRAESSPVVETAQQCLRPGNTPAPAAITRPPGLWVALA